MNKLLRGLVMLLAIVCCNQTFAQTVEMADGMRSEGKIYVVVAIVLLILTVVILYLVRLDKKLTRIESSRMEEEGNQNL